MELNKIELNEKGYTIIPSVFDSNIIERISLAMEKSYVDCREIQIKNKIDNVTDGTIHHLLATGDPVYLELVEKICLSPLFDFIKTFFSTNFILNSYGGLKNLPSKPSYVTNIHRDIRFFSGSFPLMLNMLIMLDDFTLENGATYLLAKSHLEEAKPIDDYFYSNSDRATGKTGDVLFFNSNLWHAAGVNQTNRERKAITITFAKSFMKQQLDYPRVVGYDKMDQLNPALQQVIGYFARTPASLEDWYQKPENRFYRPDQD